jgi:uncharacterized protein (TIGR03905 family)
MRIDYNTKGTCATKIHLDIENDILRKVIFERGCAGNLAGIANLVEGMPVQDVIDRLKGIPCGRKPTSCPDQLARALEMYQNRTNEPQA